MIFTRTVALTVFPPYTSASSQNVNAFCSSIWTIYAKGCCGEPARLKFMGKGNKFTSNKNKNFSQTTGSNRVSSLFLADTLPLGQPVSFFLILRAQKSGSQWCTWIINVNGHCVNNNYTSHDDKYLPTPSCRWLNTRMVGQQPKRKDHSGATFINWISIFITKIGCKIILEAF